MTQDDVYKGKITLTSRLTYDEAITNVDNTVSNLRISLESRVDCDTQYLVSLSLAADQPPCPYAASLSPTLRSRRAIATNPKDYPDPEQFRPERYLGPKPALDPGTYVFGVGRRICAGRDLADANVFLYAVTLLATSNIQKCVRADGTVVEPELVFRPGPVVKYVSSLLVTFLSVVYTRSSSSIVCSSELAPFECSVKARSDTVHLIHEYLDSTPSDLA